MKSSKKLAPSFQTFLEFQSVLLEKDKLEDWDASKLIALLQRLVNQDSNTKFMIFEQQKTLLN